MITAEEYLGDILVVGINSERASLNEAEEIKKFFERKISLGDNKIIINLSQCIFIDSTFLGVLISVLKVLNKNNGFIKLVGVTKNIKVLFEFTGINNIFESYNDVSEALQSIK